MTDWRTGDGKKAMADALALLDLETIEEDIFRGTEIRSSKAIAKSAAESHADQIPSETTQDGPLRLADEVAGVLHCSGSGRTSTRQVEAEYETPSGEQRCIEVTISPVLSTENTLLGVACVVNDVSELEQIRRQQQGRGETAAVAGK